MEQVRFKSGMEERGSDGWCDVIISSSSSNNNNNSNRSFLLAQKQKKELVKKVAYKTKMK